MRRPPDRKFVALAAVLLAAAAGACLQRPAPASAEPVSASVPQPLAVKLLGRS